MMVQHRIFLVQPWGDPPHDAAREHWQAHHGTLFAGLPALRGYRQNRPLDKEWKAGRGWICSETWFDDRAHEAEAFASDFYREQVVPDEASFLDRDNAWHAVLLDDDAPAVRDAAWRVLWFGDRPPVGPTWTGATLNRPVPGSSGVRRFHWAWFDHESDALALTASAPEEVTTFACRTHSIVVESPVGEDMER